ncbi:MAG: hypothetical protein E7233_09455 [Lachnospiraceae bacterium]|nr:hypothetical protein [Lachnospiraceae bacterium]
MKRLVVYYSLSGNTKNAAEKIAGMLDADIMKLETVKPMPKSFAAQIIVGGGQVALKHVPEIKPLEKDPAQYDEIILGTPIWNSKGVPAVNAFLKDKDAAAKVTSVFILSGGGEIGKCVDALAAQLPNLKNKVSLLDKKHEASKENDTKISQFADAVKAGAE